ncbi:MAG TPA: PEP-CTERM sorting domain-containing protein, partial [Pirellulales bacterium]|nr:PEP-CTERM sorting domain-containing protein [Pirellulales bacterium]
ALSVPTGADWQVGDVVVHTTDSANGASKGPANFLWTSPDTGLVTISGSVWRAATIDGRDNSWSLLVNGNVVSSGASIDTGGPDRAHPFLFSNGSGGTVALTQFVTAGSTIDLQITKTADSSFGFFVGANLTITQQSTTPEPTSLALFGLGALSVLWQSRGRHTARFG